MDDPSLLTAPESAGRRLRRRLLTLEVFAVIAWVAAAAAVKLLALNPWATALIAFSPALPIALCAVALFRARRNFDEFSKRVLTQAAAFAFVCFIPALLLYAMALNAGLGLPAAGWPAAFVYLSIAFGVGVWRALRRLQ